MLLQLALYLLAQIMGMRMMGYEHMGSVQHTRYLQSLFHHPPLSTTHFLKYLSTCNSSAGFRTPISHIIHSTQKRVHGSHATYSHTRTHMQHTGTGYCIKQPYGLWPCGLWPYGLSDFLCLASTSGLPSLEREPEVMNQ